MRTVLLSALAVIVLICLGGCEYDRGDYDASYYEPAYYYGPPPYYYYPGPPSRSFIVVPRDHRHFRDRDHDRDDFRDAAPAGGHLRGMR